MNTILTARLIRPLLEIGMMPGGILLVHTSFSRFSPVEGGLAGLR
jgi:aminoglycoside N3'-acetyltransferase